MAYDNNEKRMESVYSKRIRAGKRRTYFFDIRATRSNDYYLTITESRKKFNEDGYDRHKLFLYKEDFNKFIKALTEAIDYVKTDLMPDFDFDAYNHDNADGEGEMKVADDTERDGYVADNNIMGQAGVDVKDNVMAKDNTLGEDEIGTITINNTSSAPAASKDEEVDKW